MMQKNNQPYIAPFRYSPDIEGYKAAVWDFMMEHCDILNSGAIFIKFHTDSRQKFENRVLARWKYNYHRDDPVKKIEEADNLRKTFIETKTEKKGKYLKRKDDQKNTWRRKLKRFLLGFINKL